MNKKYIFILLSLIFSYFVFSQTGAQAVNRRTAVRCLKLAQTYLASNDCGGALSQAELGLSYDDSISDLWYIKATAKLGLGECKAEIIPLVMKSLTEGEWVDYNRDGARVLYADLLCDTGNLEQAITILDSHPFIYSSDAEFIRAKAFYRSRTEENIRRARDKINSARKIYPQDLRFPRLFLKYEYDFHRAIYENIYDFTEEDELLVQKIADSFIAKMPEYDNPDAELEIYAAYFAQGERQKRMAQAFTSHGLNHPLYAIVALNSKLMSQQEAWDYLCSFADKEIDFSYLQDFFPLVSDEITIESVKEHLNAFNGVLKIDTDADCEPNLIVSYMRGRPLNIVWDSNNDGVNEWTCDCDFGVPETLLLTRGNFLLTYGTYPAIIKAVYKSAAISDGLATFNLMDETMEWSPFNILPFEMCKELFDFDFFVPVVKLDAEELNENLLLYNCSSYEINSKERSDSIIKFSVLNGLPQSAEYYSLGSVYAHAIFENGFPILRSVDNDGDGIFETVETFDYDPDNLLHRTSVDQEQVMTNLFGLPIVGSGIYLRMLQIDSNGDTIPDFTEEYLADEGKITSWDFNSDRIWDLRYKRYPRANADEPLVEDSQFYTEPEHKIVTITSWDKIPVKVQVENENLIVTQGLDTSFYWIGQEGSSDDEKYVLDNIVPYLQQGISKMAENQKKRIKVIKIGDYVFTEILPDYDESLYEAE